MNDKRGDKRKNWEMRRIGERDGDKIQTDNQLIRDMMRYKKDEIIDKVERYIRIR